MKTFRFIVSNILILNFSVLLWATAMCPCSQAIHEETQCSHSKNSHSSMAQAGDSSVMAHKMDTNQIIAVVHSGSAKLRNKTCCCQSFDIKKESPATITPVTLTKTKSTEINLESGDHFVYDHGLFVPDDIALRSLKIPDSNPGKPPFYLLNSAFLI